MPFKKKTQFVFILWKTEPHPARENPPIAALLLPDSYAQRVSQISDAMSDRKTFYLTGEAS